MEFGYFVPLCERARIPVCNLFDQDEVENNCYLQSLDTITNLGSVVVDSIAIIVALVMMLLAGRASGVNVAKCEMLIFDFGYVLLSFFEIFSLGGFLSQSSFTTVKAFSALHVATIPSVFWVLSFTAITSMQWWCSGTKKAIGVMMGLASVIFILTAWPAFDTAFGWSLFFARAAQTGFDYWLYVMYLIIPLFFMVIYMVFQAIVILTATGKPKLLLVLLAAVLFFALGQITTFLLSTRICYTTNERVDGAAFQSLLNFFAFLCVHALWGATSERIETFTNSSVWNYDYTDTERDKERVITQDVEIGSFSTRDRDVSANFFQRQAQTPAPLYKTIVPPAKGVALSKALDALDFHETEFLDLVEHEIAKLIINSSPRDCCAIVQISPSGARTRYGLSDPKDWWKRFIKLARYNPGPNDPPLPPYNGNSTLDSYLSQPIVDRVLELHVQFLQEHREEVGQAMIGMLNDNPDFSRELVIQIAKSIRASSEPMTDKVYEALAHMLTESLNSGIGQQLGSTIGHVASHSVTASFSTAIVHALTSAVAKLMVKYATVEAVKNAALHAGGKVVTVSVLTSVFTALLGHMTVGGASLSAGAIAWIVVIPIVVAFATYQVIHFPKELASKVAPKVRAAMAGTNFRQQNRSALSEIYSQATMGGALALAKAMVGEMPEVKHAKHAAEEYFKEAEQRAADAIRR